MSRGPGLFMVIENFRGGDPAPVYERFRARGRLAPEGLRYVASWVDAGLGRCWQVMEADDRAQLDAWIARWSDLVEFEVHEVLTSAQATERVLGPGAGAAPSAAAAPAAPVAAGGTPAARAAAGSAPAAPSVRAATPADAGAIARHRVRLFAGLLPAERRAEAEALLAPSRDAVREALEAGSSLAWVADGPEPAGSLVMHLVRRLPSPTSPSGREGYVVHVYVEDGRRDSGLGAALLAAAEAAGRALGLSRIRLHAVERALPFYRRAGYELRTNDMQRFLR
jgi:GNAT superfamily N-acetyltransferase